MLQAENLHREVALLSNQLHTFPDEDFEGPKELIDQIIQKREEWKNVRRKIEHFEKFGTLPIEEKKEKTTYAPDDDASLAELQVKLLQCQNLIRNKRHKLKNKSDSSKSQAWKEELAILELEERELKSTIIQKKYEKS